VFRGSKGFNRVENFRIIMNGDNRWICHNLSSSKFSFRFLPKSNLWQRFVKQFIRVAVTPMLVRLEGFDDRVTGRMKMLRCMAVRAGIAAADVPASFAKAQVNPPASRFQAFLTAARSLRFRRLYFL
jgi:hypothetical protein